RGRGRMVEALGPPPEGSREDGRSGETPSRGVADASRVRSRPLARPRSRSPDPLGGPREGTPPQRGCVAGPSWGQATPWWMRGWALLGATDLMRGAWPGPLGGNQPLQALAERGQPLRGRG